MANDGRIGVESSGVTSAISNLDTEKASLATLLGDMMTLKTQVVTDWESQASQTFDINYTNLNNDMNTMCDAVEAFKNWADESLQCYAALDSKQSTMMSEI